MIKINKNTTAILLSLALHLLVIALFISYATKIHDIKPSIQNTIITYLHVPHNNITNILQKHKITKPVSANNNVKTQAQSTQLPAILHDLIQANLSYPSELLQTNGNKTLTIAFLLFPAGNTANIKILKSSGLAILDQAAIAAVHAIQPVTIANQFLTASDTFAVTIEFQ